MCDFIVLVMILRVYGVFLMQTVAQEGQAQAWRAVNRTAVARLEARGTRTQRTTVVSVTSPAKVCPTTRYGRLQSHSTDNKSMQFVSKSFFLEK